MPDPQAVAALIDRAEELASRVRGPLMRLPSLHRRRLLAEGVLEALRRDTPPLLPALEPVPA